MERQPKVSVLMGMFNESANLETALNSILKQSFQDFEVFLCDDASTDNSFEIAKSICGSDPRFHLLRNEKNEGVAASVNRCLPLAKGEYVARMDLDDICSLQRFEKEVAFLDAHPDVSLCSSLAYCFDEQGIYGLLGSSGLKHPKDNFFVAPYVQPSAMIRRSAFVQAGGYDPNCRRSQDYDLWCKFGSLGFVGYVIDEPLLFYRCNTRDLQRKRTKKNVLFVWKLHKKWRKKLGVPLFSLFLFGLKTIAQLCIPTRLRNRINRSKMSRNLRLYSQKNPGKVDLPK